MPIKLKPEFKNIRIGFNNSSKKLGERDDLHILYDIAIRKGEKGKAHLNMFEEVPNERELDAVKEKIFKQKQDAKNKNPIPVIKNKKSLNR